jgi:hypothetical protein
MEFKAVTDSMIHKEGGTGNTGISALIREQLEAIPEGSALAMVELANFLLKENLLPNRHQAYIRINNVLKSEWGQQFQRLIDKTDNYTYIARKPKE